MRIFVLLAFTLLGAAAAPAEELVLDLQTARLRLDAHGMLASLDFKDDAAWKADAQPIMTLTTKAGELLPQRVARDGNKLMVEFDKQHTATFELTFERGFLLARLKELTGRDDVKRFRLCTLPTPGGGSLASTLNAYCHQKQAAALLALEVNVHAFSNQAGYYTSDRPGCSHRLVQTAEGRVGRAAVFTATADAKPGGWSMQGAMAAKPRDLSGLKALRCWVHGDGQGQMLKLQMADGRGGFRDYYVKVDFTGWRQETIEKPSFDTLRLDHVAAMNYYFNSLPPGKSVSCRIDQVEAIVARDSGDETVLLEDFESPTSPLWAPLNTLLNVETVAAHGIVPAGFALLACPIEELPATLQRVEQVAGLPSPRLEGAWAKISPAVKRSYFFLTRFDESQADEALAIARRGGFSTILLGQESWADGTGHYEINRKRFPDGLEGLKRTVAKFQKAGFKVGLHFLGPSVYTPDKYITPVPDARLVKGARGELSADVDEKAAALPLAAAPADFPAEDGGYEGAGTTVQIDDELIYYGRRGAQEPFELADCRRGYLGTKAAAHKKGAVVRHLVRAYGYHMFDMDTSLLDEVAGNFAKVAGACNIDMIYFDGSERLQGDHWYYNARLHKAFYDKLPNKNLLMQASSTSHYSWHILSRSASADGHDDLKAYLDQRSPGFLYLASNYQPLDIGWYYGYDANCPLDMYEYVLGATIGYDSSMSFQVSVDGARQHPFTGSILDLIARYEKLRLSGRVSADMRQRLRIDPAAAGVAAKQPETLWRTRREYRLVGDDARPRFQRVQYQPWQAMNDTTGVKNLWPVEIPAGGGKVGFMLHAQQGPWLAAGEAYYSDQAITLESFSDLRFYARIIRGDRVMPRVESGNGGATYPGVEQTLELIDDAPEGGTAALYTARSTLPGRGGWAMYGRRYNPPLDLSAHRGIGFWMRGDGQGGQFKLQLHDGRAATDYYIANDFTGWRYQQLARPAKDPIDYTKVAQLALYYNGLPGKTTVACGLDDIKALPSLDKQQAIDPQIDIAGQTFIWKGTLTEGQYLVFWPGEPIRRYSRGVMDAENTNQTAPIVSLSAGNQEAAFRVAGPLRIAIRARAMLELPESYDAEAK